MRDLIQKQGKRQLQFHSPLGPDQLIICSMHGDEALSQPFCWRLQLQSTRKDISAKQLLGKAVSLQMHVPQQDARQFNGIVTRFARSGGFGHYAFYQLEVRPWLWLLGKTQDCRIFQQKTVVDIVKEICDKGIYGGLPDLDVGRLRETYPRLNYCVQYRETDLNFISRLLQKFGIWYYFEHKDGKHKMVLMDYVGSHKPVPGYGSIRFASDGSRDRYGDETISVWEEAGDIQSGAYELNDFDFERVQVSTNGGLQVKESVVAHEQVAYEIYDYPGTYTQAADGKLLAKVGMEQMHGGSEMVRAAGNARGLQSGALFDLREHPLPQQNQTYLITSAQYELQAEDYETGAGSGLPLFHCSFQAVGREYRYRPQVTHRKPLVYGPQTALVVGKAGEEIWTDKYGRVKVQFHWDREGEDNEKSSCWVRVAQSWAGKRWGTMFIPRIGMEVVVEFLDGDPDQPLITGCVYNGDYMPPYDLPANQTRSTIKTHSSKDGTGFNELRFEDKKGAEEVFMHAELDFNRVVKRHDSTRVGFGSKQPGNQSIAVKGNQATNVGNDQENVIGHDQNTRVENISTLEAKTAIVLKVGDSIIEMTPDGITIKGKVLDVNGESSAKYHGGPIVLEAPTININ